MWRALSRADEVGDRQSGSQDQLLPFQPAGYPSPHHARLAYAMPSRHFRYLGRSGNGTGRPAKRLKTRYGPKPRRSDVRGQTDKRVRKE